MITLGGGIYFSHKKQTEKALLNEAERIKQILSRQRHDFLNHIQVLMGYQTMKKSERIIPYLQKLVKEALNERAVCELHYPPLTVTLLTLAHRYRQWEIRIQVENQFQLPGQRDEQHLLCILEEVFPWLEKQVQEHDDWNQVQIGLSREGQQAILTIEMFSDDGSLVTFDFPSHEWEQLRNHISRWKGESFPLHDHKGIKIVQNL
nr:Spo0B domain-containing protein [Paenactinomyces guangxiensis]